MPKLVKKSIKSVKTVKPETPAPPPKRQPTVCVFVPENKFRAIKLCCNNMVESNITLREILAVVNHLVEVSAGREIEAYAAASQKTLTPTKRVSR